MKILSCVPSAYYGLREIQTYEQLAFVDCLRLLGHEVDCIDHLQLCAQKKKEAFNELLLSQVRKNRYDLVWIVLHEDEFYPEVLNQIKQKTVLLAWNCDDNRRWESYSKNWAMYFHWMVTTYRDVYESNKQQYPNLLLSQWGATGFVDGRGVCKVKDVSFVGFVYGDRRKQLETLYRHFFLEIYGRGSFLKPTFMRRFKKKLRAVLNRPSLSEERILLDQQAVKEIWNQSKISFTPLMGIDSEGLQIKARVFDMGLSHTVMICEKNPALYEFYEPQKEYVEFQDMDECVDQIKFLLKEEAVRRKIAEAYYVRTQREHLWEHRFKKLFMQIQLS